MSGNVIDSLFVALGFKVDDAGLGEFAGKMAGVAQVAVGVGAALAAAAAGVGLFVAEIAEGVDDLGDWAERENFGIEAAQELGHAAQLSGSSMEALKSSVEGVNKVLGEAALGVGRGAQTFQKLGMSAKNADGSMKSVDSLLSEVADKMQGLSRQEQVALAEKLGIDRSLIPMLQKGGDEIAKLRAEAREFGIVTEKDAAIAGEFMDSLDRTKAVVFGMSRAIGIALMPAIKEVIDGVREWFLENGKIIKSGIIATIEVLGTVISRVWYWLRIAVDAGIRAVKWVSQFDGALRVAAIAAAAFLAPFITLPVVIGAALAAIALFLDDFEAWQNGDDSLIGDLLKDFPKLEPWIIGLWAALNTLWDLIVMSFEGWVMLLDVVGDAIGDIWDIGVATFTVISDAIFSVISAVQTMIGWFVSAYETLRSFGDAVADFFSNNPLTKGIMVAANVVGDALGANTGGNSAATVGDAISKAPAITGEATPESSAGIGGAQAGGVIGKAADQPASNNQTTNNNVQVTAPITVNSPDPAKAGESVRAELNKVNKQATRNGESAVAL